MARARSAGPMRGRSGRLGKGFAKRMSDNVAIALVVYTLMLIFIVTPSIETEGVSIFPYFLLVILVGGAIPVLRRFEHRWALLDDSELSDSGLKHRFAMDRTKLWILAIGVPFLLSIACAGLKTIL
ncbi:hypothetical protein ACFOWX_03100 [Sphingorhabdus arenilitoris]|uniref:Uncharacterized protein n=1 Tax=Sphingorhabdus arenilitoris TaxID=1490041 RepID=A0ABV8RDI9_9SPHN